jgi:hypothetical protein
MRQIFAAIVTVLLPLSSLGSEPTASPQQDRQLIEQMRRRIEQLEKQVAELEPRLAAAEASARSPSVTPMPWYRQGSVVPPTQPPPHPAYPGFSWPAVKQPARFLPDGGMKADELEHQQRIKDYLRHRGLEPLDPTHLYWPGRSFHQDER